MAAATLPSAINRVWVAAEAMSVHTFHVHCGSCEYTEMLAYPAGHEDSEAIYPTVDELNELEELDARDTA